MTAQVLVLLSLVVIVETLIIIYLVKRQKRIEKTFVSLLEQLDRQNERLKKKRISHA